MWDANLYIETSILRKLPSEVATAEFLKLKEWCKVLRMGILLPRLALEEWITYHLDRLEVQISRIEECVNDINRRAVSKLVPPSVDKALLMEECRKNLEGNVARAGIQIVETPNNINVDELLAMSLRNIPPFDARGEKGFRDSVILFTVLEHAKQFPQKMGILLAEDENYDCREVYERFKSHKVELKILKSIPTAHQYLDEFIGEQLTLFEAELEGKLKQFLNGYRENIVKFIEENAKFTATFITVGRSLFGTARAIKNIELLEIHTASSELLPDGVGEGDVKISFMAKLRFTILWKPFSPLPSLPYLRDLTQTTSASVIASGDEAVVNPYSVLLSRALGGFVTEQNFREEIFVKDVPVEGKARRRGLDDYRDFKMDRVLTW